ncbi:MAG: hypothetical protein ACXVCI_18730 [Bdellovibrionota bacterium]
MRIFSLLLALISCQAFAAQSLDISHANFQSYDIVTRKCDVRKDSESGEMAATISGTAAILLKGGTTISISLAETGGGYGLKSTDACTNARADLFSKETTQWLINLLDSIQAGQLFVEGPGVCTTPTLRIYDASNFQSVPYSGINGKTVPAACPN